MLSDKNTSVLLHYYNKCIEYNSIFTLYLLTNSSIHCKYCECYVSHWDELSSLTTALDAYFFHL